MADYKLYRDNPKIRELDQELGRLLRELEKLDGRRDFLELQLDNYKRLEADVIKRRENWMITSYEFECTHHKILESARVTGESLRFVNRDIQVLNEKIANVRADAAELINKLKAGPEAE